VVNPAALVRRSDPPVKAEYHLKVPALALVADNITVPVPQRAAGVGVGAVATALTVAVTATRGVLSHVPLLNVT
jgi:hypothetical protein